MRKTSQQRHPWAERCLRAILKGVLCRRTARQWRSVLVTRVVVPGVYAATERQQPAARKQERILRKESERVLPSTRIHQRRFHQRCPRGLVIICFRTVAAHIHCLYTRGNLVLLGEQPRPR